MGQMRQHQIQLRRMSARDLSDFMSYGTVATLGDVPEEMMAHWFSRMRQSPSTWWYAITLASTGQLVGDIQLTAEETGLGKSAAVLSYQVAPSYQRRGYATAGLNLALTRAFARGLTQISASTWDDHVVSQHLLTKMGFHVEQHRPPDDENARWWGQPNVGETFFRLTAAEWWRQFS